MGQAWKDEGAPGGGGGRSPRQEAPSGPAVADPGIRPAGQQGRAWQCPPPRPVLRPAEGPTLRGPPHAGLCATRPAWCWAASSTGPGRKADPQLLSSGPRSRSAGGGRRGLDAGEGLRQQGGGGGGGQASGRGGSRAASSPDQSAHRGSRHTTRQGRERRRAKALLREAISSVRLGCGVGFLD